MKNPQKIAIIGAGIVGVSIARRLARTGFDVTIIDRQEPGMGTSYGNAGHLASEQIIPLASKATLAQIPKMLLSPLGPLSIRWRDFPHLLPWFLRFALATRKKQFKQGIQALTSLSIATQPSWQRLLQEEQSLGALVKSSGTLDIYETEKAFRKGLQTLKKQQAVGIEGKILDRPAIDALAPGLKNTVRHGISFPNCSMVTNPYEMVSRIMDAAQNYGTKYKNASVTGFRQENGRIKAVLIDKGEIEADAIILAAGVWSAPLVSQLGLKTPLVAERGYHMTFPHTKPTLSCPVVVADRGFILTPMDMGLRAAGTVEFARLGAPETPARAQLLTRHTKDLLPETDTSNAQYWMGNRPSLPDFLPAIGPVPSAENVFCAYGHHHLGLTFSQITAEIIEYLVLGKNSPVDISAFNPARF